MLIPGGVSQAYACDGNLYSICHDYQKAQPNTIPLNKNFQVENCIFYPGNS